MKKLAIILGTAVLATVAVLGGAVTPASAQGYGYSSWWGGPYAYDRGAYARSYAYAPGYRTYRRGFRGRPYRSWWGGGY